ncbi:NodT family efflux transporter outer membrane factor (OMF) lipoprotein [Luteibacter sp. Sphag1AF]|uniref:efflux transporter outer membrane subunit n=1 Tax=Luteibacter sp. Sphag1AF TaxID=2587031 RepID=UPI0016206D89|nr:efflux transporter outer membrane subunit [Luteibacter sp. Sphag1AF]MBB3228265.1 NodT family efflux transporter outer membrane factor (OMF) lipoprotein [Luteibacter sp. Sphag1AF]
MNMQRLALASSLLVLLAGCAAVGPDYRVPASAKVNLPAAHAAFIDEHNTAVDGTAVAPDAWWTLYDDATLNALENQAFEANAGLKAAEANLRRAYAVADMTRAEGGFSGGASATAERTLISAESFLQSEKLPTFSVAAAGVTASYEFDLFGKLARATEAANADADAVQATRDLARITVAAQVAHSYISLCETAHDLDIATHTIEIQQHSADIARRMLDAGLGNRIDVTRATTQVDLARAVLPALQRRREASGYALAALLGRTPGDIPAQAQACHEAPHLAQAMPVGDGMALLRRRPDVREAERRLAAATARIGVATAELYPTVSIGGSLGDNGVLADFGKAPARYWSIGPLITWSFPTKSAHERVRATEAGADAALAQFDQTVLDALKETQTALSDYARALEHQAALHQALADATLASDQAHALYKAGRAPYLSSLDAERTRSSTEAADAEADNAVSDAQIRLFFALGGGWKRATPAP